MAALARIPAMTAHATPFQICRAAPLRRRYAAAAEGVNAQERAGVTGTEIDLVAMMLAVRDRQDRAAFAALFRYFAPRIKGFLMKSGTDAAVAEECVQDVMTTLWNKAHLYDPTRAGVATWVFTIARNRRIDLARRDRRPEPEDIPWMQDGTEPDQAEVFEAAEENRRLAQALADLPEKQRALI